MKTLAVIIPNYNHGKYIRNALNAILSQSRRPDQVVVVDDGSSDNSVEILTEYQSVPGFKLLINDRNRGLAYSVNRGLDCVTTDYMFMASADDLILPGFFEKTMAALERWPEAGLCAAHPGFLIDETGETDLNEKRPKVTQETRYFSPTDLEGMLAPEGLWIAGHATVLNRLDFIKAGRNFGQLRWHCDWFGMYTVALRKGICYIPETLSLLRIGHNSYSVEALRNPQAQANVMWELGRILNLEQFVDVKDKFITSGLLDHNRDYKERLLAMLVPWGEKRQDYLPGRIFIQTILQAFKQEIKHGKMFLKQIEHKSLLARSVLRFYRSLRDWFRQRPAQESN